MNRYPWHPTMQIVMAKEAGLPLLSAPCPLILGYYHICLQNHFTKPIMKNEHKKQSGCAIAQIQPLGLTVNNLELCVNPANFNTLLNSRLSSHTLD